MMWIHTLNVAARRARMLVACIALSVVGCEDEVPNGPSSGPAAGVCCAGGDCVCHGNPPLTLTSGRGQFGVANFGTSTGRVYYPTNAEAPFAGVALCGGFLNSGPEMNSWGTFYASHGIVTIITNTGALDFPDVRGRKLLAAINTLKQENGRLGSPLNGKMAGRYGTSGYSMGGGGTTLATRSDRTLKSSVGLAAWAPNGSGVQTPTLFLCGSADVIASCGGSRNAYNAMPNSTPKMLVTAPLAGHLDWFGPGNAGAGLSGKMALAFQKVYLEGDERWKDLLRRGPSITVSNIQ